MSKLFPFQNALVDWSFEKCRSAIFADCGLGKTPMQLQWAQRVIEKTNKPVLVLTPLAVGAQTVREGEKFGVDCFQSRDGKWPKSKKIIVTNYEKLHLFSDRDFAGLVADESGILKNMHGSTRNEVVAFSRNIGHRLLCSATPAPNDYTELGNSVEALGIMRMVEMLAKYFIHDSSDTGNWRLKGHAQDPFWRFVASWARAIRHPRDIGFDADGYDLPDLTLTLHTLKSAPLDGFLFPSEAVTLDEQRAERRSTIEARCAQVAKIANAGGQFLAWCSLNDESALLTEYIDGAVELSGSDSDDEKEEKVLGFASGAIRALVTKPKICSHGVNWQSCHAMSFFPSHSHEQFYQAVRRCWRFGQTKEVTVHIVTTEAESLVLDNLRRKERDASAMFFQIVKNMSAYYSEARETYNPQQPIKIPSWIKS